MANELHYEHGFQVTLQFKDANIAANTTTKCVLSGEAAPTNPGFVVPTGYAFHALSLSCQLTAAGSAGSLALNVTDDGTALASGPTIAITTETVKSGLYRPGADPIAADAVVGVNIVATADWNGTSSDIDVVLLGTLLPA
jgi:hypothetical protein